MPVPPDRARRRSNWLFAVLAILATAAQLVVAVVPLAEGRAVKTPSAHVEAGGATGHYAHNDATCASCQARSMFGTTSRATVALPAGANIVTLAVTAVERASSADAHSPSNPRAPPALI